MNAHPLDASATVPDLSVYFNSYTQKSADARAALACSLDVRYGPADAETLDFFPAGPGAPLAIFFHGGYWRRLDKADFSFIALGLIPHGIAFMSVNYALAPHAALVEIVAQARRAVRWTVANTAKLDVDPARISVFGHSAGGHLAAMAAIETPLHSLVTLSGLHDLRPVRDSFANEWLNLDDASADALSPINFAPAVPLPVYASAGERETEAFKAQGRALSDAWRERGCRSTYEDSPGDDHFSIVERLADPANALTQTIVDLAR